MTLSQTKEPLYKTFITTFMKNFEFLYSSNLTLFNLTLRQCRGCDGAVPNSSEKWGCGGTPRRPKSVDKP